LPGFFVFALFLTIQSKALGEFSGTEIRRP